MTEKTSEMEQQAMKALKTGLMIGGTLFAGYQLVRLFTRADANKDVIKKKALSSL